MKLEDSIFEVIVENLFKDNPTASMEEVSENSMVLLSRLLFIHHFEAQYEILRAHPVHVSVRMGYIRYARLPPNTPYRPKRLFCQR